MTSTYTSRETRIEQALAFGRSHEWIRKHLGVPQSEIDTAICRMNAACTEDAEVRR